MRGRRVITRSGCRPRGSFPSAKLGRQVHFESILEKHACYLLEFSPGVIRYQEQVQIELPDGEVRFPDFEIIDSSGSVRYIEVKAQQQLCRPEVGERLKYLSDYLISQGYGYCVLTEKEINRQPRLENLKLLFAYRSPCSVGLDAFTESLLPTAPTSFRVLVRKAGCQRKALSLLADQHLIFDIDAPFSQDVLVSRPAGDHHASLLF